MDEAGEVGVAVRVRIHDRVAYPGLRREVDHTRRPVTPEHVGHRLTVRDINPLETELRVWHQSVESRLLECWIVKLAQIVQSDDAVAVCQETLRDVVTDEPGGTREENGHALTIFSRPCRTSRVALR